MQLTLVHGLLNAWNGDEEIAHEGLIPPGVEIYPDVADLLHFPDVFSHHGPY
jgi:hypothetical protein